MKILKVFFALFLLFTAGEQLQAQNCNIGMHVRESSATASMPEGNECFVATVTSETPEYLYIGYHHCRKESTEPVTSLRITLCFGPNSCGPTYDSNTTEDNVYYIECGIAGACREGCDVTIDPL